MKSRIQRMQEGDRSALRELLEDHGAAIAEAARRLVGAEDDALIEAAAAIWRATVVTDPALDERGFAVSKAIAALLVASLEPADPSRFAEVDRAGLIRRTAQVAAGLGDAHDREVLTEIRASAPDLEPTLAKLDAAIARGLAAPARALSPFGRLWSRIEPTLR